MDKLTLITTIASAVSAVAVAVSLILLLLQLHRMRFTQEVTVALGLYDRSTSPEMLEAVSWVKTEMSSDVTYDDYRSNPEVRSRLEHLWYYFEFLGVLVDRGYVNEDIVFDQQGAFIAGIWDKTQHLYHRAQARSTITTILGKFRDSTKSFSGLGRAKQA